MTTTVATTGGQPFSQFTVQQPSGGVLYLQSAEEVDLYALSKQKFKEDYHLTKTNDLVLVSALLQQQIQAFRATRALNGMVAGVDSSGRPDGSIVHTTVEVDDAAKWAKALTEATKQIHAIEGSLGIDKKTREGDGTYSVENYLRNLKAAARSRAIHLVKRTQAYEAFTAELRVKLHILRNADDEDRRFHNITEASILAWCHDQLAALEEADKVFAREYAKLYGGKL